ncbi:MAG: CheR family methyltransferase [Spirochaetales bacterium]
MIGEQRLEELRHYLEHRLSLVVPETNFSRLAEFVGERLAARVCSFAEYLEYLAIDAAEMDLLIQVSTIGETYFFRDEDHFTLLQQQILPFFASQGHTPLAWSAAASTGEEALSLAALYADFFGSTLPLGGKIWASDINNLALESLVSGSYSFRSLRDDGSRFHPLLEPWLTRGTDHLQVDSRLNSQVQARHINLMTDSFESIPGRVDILFLKNMLIYFPLERRKAIYRKVSEKLSPEGFLILGKSEVPFFEDPGLKLLEHGGLFFFVAKTSSFEARSLP